MERVANAFLYETIFKKVSLKCRIAILRRNAGKSSHYENLVDGIILSSSDRMRLLQI